MTIHATLRYDDSGRVSHLTELVDQPYGSRQYAVTNPEGDVWSVGTYRPAVEE